MAGARKSNETDRLWREFAQRHKGNHFLRLDPLYSLPEPLIDIIAGNKKGDSEIERRGVAPDFWSKDELKFERDLAQTTSGGFFRKHPFRCLLLSNPTDPLYYENQDKIEQLQTDVLVAQGVSPHRVQKMFEKEEQYNRLADDRALAYAGWLVTTEHFRKDRDTLRKEWGGYVDQNDQFPRLPDPVLAEMAFGAPDRRSKEYAHFKFFFHRWGLQTFLTWDLPVPVRPAIHGAGSRSTFGLSEAGLDLFVPWYVLRDGRFALKELAHLLQSQRNPTRLAGWLGTTTTKKDKLGDIRFRYMLVLYRYQKLAIEQRYRSHPSWDTAQQDFAFAKYLNVSEGSIRPISGETVRQIRLKLQQRLPKRQG